MSAKRTREIAIRLTDAELADVRAKAAGRGVGMADLARQLLADAEGVEVQQTRRVRGTAPRQRPAPRADPALVQQIARAGSNLNQIAKWANTHKAGADAVQVIATLAAIDRELSEIVDAH